MFNLLIIVSLGTIFFSCLLTPAVYSLILSIWPGFPWPFSRVFDRVVLAVALILLWIFRKKIGLDEVKSCLRVDSKSGSLKHFSIGLFLALCSALVVLPLVVNGPLGWAAFSASSWIARVPKILLTAVVVSILEETVFRGIFFARLVPRIGVFFAAVLSSAVYAVVHFLTPQKSFLYSGFDPFAGFEYFGVISARLLQPGILQGIVGLFAVGVVLCIAFLRTRKLYLSIGMHAGWVCAIKASMYLTVVSDESLLPAGLGRRYFLVGMPEIWLSVILAGVLVLLIFRRDDQVL